MELLESDDMKNHLLRKSAKQREELEDEVRLVSERTEKVITNALIIGGSLALAYILVRQFSGTKKKKSKGKARKVKLIQQNIPAEEAVEEEDSEPGVMAQVGAALVSQASVLLLNLAKDKLTEFLQNMGEKKQENNERS